MSSLPISEVPSKQSQSHQSSAAGGINLGNVSSRVSPPILKCMKTSFQSFPRFINEFLFSLRMIRPPSPLASSFPLNDALCLHALCMLVRARRPSRPSRISAELKSRPPHPRLPLPRKLTTAGFSNIRRLRFKGWCLFPGELAHARGGPALLAMQMKHDLWMWRRMALCTPKTNAQSAVPARRKQSVDSVFSRCHDSKHLWNDGCGGLHWWEFL